MEKLKQFIEDNKITFEVGRRNSDSVCVAGFCLHKKFKYDASVKLLKKNLPRFDKAAEEEFRKVWKYADEHDYKFFWETMEAKRLYKFE